MNLWEKTKFTKSDDAGYSEKLGSMPIIEKRDYRGTGDMPMEQDRANQLPEGGVIDFATHQISSDAQIIEVKAPKKKQTKS